MKDFGVVLFAVLVAVAIFLLQSWIISVFSAPLLTTFGLPTVSAKAVAGGLISYFMIRCFGQFFTPGK